MEEFAAFIGLDWADKKHDGCLQVAGSKKLERFRLEQKANEIASWASSLCERFPNRKVAVALEQKRGALIFSLMKYDFIVLFPTNPSTLAWYRNAFAPSGAKDDPTDAEFLLEILTLHRDRLKAWNPDTEQTRTLQYLVEQRRTLVDDRKRLGNRLTDLLKVYYPQILALFPKMGREVLCEFILRYPTLADAQVASDIELVSFFRESRSGKSSLLEKRLQIIRTALHLTTDTAVVSTHSMMATALCEQMLSIVKCIRAFDARIEEVFDSHPDAKIFKSLPAAGDILTPRLLAAFGTDRSRFESAEEVQRFSGIAPVTERSGNTEWIHWRFNCNKFLRQSFQEWAGVTIQHSLWARAFYAMQRKKGKPHPASVRVLAFKWIRIIFKLWKENKTYSEATHLAALQRSGSPIFRFLAENPALEKLRFSEIST